LKKEDISANDMYQLAIDIHNSNSKYKKVINLRKKLFNELPKMNLKQSKSRKYKKDIVLAKQVL
jgi:hypothetical protein